MSPADSDVPEDLLPLSVDRAPGALVIAWSNGAEHTLEIRALRRRCPCATCLEKALGGPVASQQQNGAVDSTDAAQPLALPIVGPEHVAELEIIDFQPIGNYAYRIGFSDGHGTGVYTLEYLYQLGSELQK